MFVTFGWSRQIGAEVMENFDQLVKLLRARWTLDCRSGSRSATLSSLGKYGDKAPSNPFSLFLSPRRAAAPTAVELSTGQRRFASIYPQFPVDNSILLNLPVDILWISGS
jgi:hypothetical protein